ncbi:MAG: hypothetical protein ABEI77_01640 [Halorientalis sp.]
MEAESVQTLLKIYWQRQDVLLLLGAGVADKQAVGAELDVSRPTLDRIYRELRAAGIVRSDGVDELTAFGEFVCQNLRQTRRVLDPLVELRDVLSTCPGKSDLERRVLDGAVVLSATGEESRDPLVEAIGRLRDAGEIKWYAPTIRPAVAEALSSFVVDADLSLTLVCTPSSLDTVLGLGAEPIRLMLEAARTTIYETLVRDCYGLVLTDRVVAVEVSDESDQHRAVVVNDADPALEWVGDVFSDRVTDDQTRQL